MTAGPGKSLVWSHGVVSVETLGAMLGPTLFVLPDGRQIAPFHIAPWFDGDEAEGEPGILQRLRGEWPCVPFGAAADRTAHQGWPGSVAAEEPDPNPHGFGANNHWQWLPSPDTELALAVDYPADHPISRLERRVHPIPGLPAIDFELSIHARAACTLPIGLHPTFRLPADPGAMQLDINAAAAATFPGQVDPSSILAPDQIAPDWHAITLTDGTVLDPSRLPLARHTEDLVQLLGADGHAALHNRAENYRVSLDWNPDHFPSLLLWISNRGRQHAPWNGRHLALGVEPICSAFDLGSQISSAPNPISARGYPTARIFQAGEVFVTRYRVCVDPA
ncbi:MAG: hypothetical protein ACOH2H_00610 [Cypionkella sp.]